LKEKRSGKEIPTQWRFRPLTTGTFVSADNVWNTVLPLTSDINLFYVSAKANAVLNGNPADGMWFRYTLDTNVLTSDAARPAGPNIVYYGYVNDNSDGLTMTTVQTPAGIFGSIYARSLMIEMMTVRVGAGNRTVAYYIRRVSL